MHRALLGFAALSAAILVSTPVSARDRAFVGSPTAPADRFAASPGLRGDLCRGRGDGRSRRDVCRSELAMDWYGGEWALYNNRSWAPDSYNDWWNDRPDRAYPAWMRRNQDCQRQWFSGDVLRC
ncbi:MAG: hypothetical protein ABI454_03095 [Sphingomicrobium sp.]